VESKEQQTPNKQGTHPHLSGSTEIKNKGREKEKWNLHSFNQLVMERMKVARKETRSYDPNPLVGHHNHATKWHKAIPSAHSDAVVIARSIEMPWSKWYEHMSW
jgi:hypothetical protein